MEFDKDPKWNYALSYGELKHYKDEVYYNVDKRGNKHYWKDGKYHRDDGPALECPNGRKFWYKEGKCHRLDGPAIECADGHKQWWIEGRIYTQEEFNHKIKMMEFEKDPKWKSALFYGELKHYKDEVYYNVDRIKNKRYWKDGLRHREDGPAVEYEDGSKGWFIKGERYTEEWFNKKVKKMEFEKDPKWTEALSFGELKHYKDEVYYNIDRVGNKNYWKNGKLHRDDGPAIEYASGGKQWFIEYKRHRLDGPAIELADGSKSWWIDGKEYKEEEFNHKIKKMEFEKDTKWKDALSYGELKHYKDEIYYNVDKNGNKRYWRDGIEHRDDGPAIERLTGNKEWYKEGKLHRLDGPAIEWKNGDKEWFIEGEYYDEEEFNDIVNNKCKQQSDNFSSFQDINSFKKFEFSDANHNFCYLIKDKIKLLNGIYCLIINNTKSSYYYGALHDLNDLPAKLFGNEVKHYSYGIESDFDFSIFEKLISENKITFISNNKDGQLHSFDDNPAIVGLIEDKEYSFWFENGIVHRKNNPAIISNDIKIYCENGIIHNKNGPAVIINDRIEYRKDGKLHRTDGPALEIKTIKKEWRIDGVLHRDDGPAIEYKDSKSQWYKNGEKITEPNLEEKEEENNLTFPLLTLAGTAIFNKALENIAAQNKLLGIAEEKIIIKQNKQKD